MLDTENPKEQKNTAAHHKSTDDMAENAAEKDIVVKAVAGTDADELQELRALLLGGPPEDMLNPPLSPEALSKVLPEAMSQAHERQTGIIAATLPTVETAIQTSVQQNASVLAEALFPVIGPATRRSITTAIGSLVQSLNQTLDHSLSPQSFKWRLEAKRTGKTFAEVVLIRTLIYQVEQVFLIHKETGLVVQHIVAKTATAQDPDLVSAMLTAIQDFVHDSFTVEDTSSLETLRLGDLSLLIENGPQAVLACAVRGTSPAELRELLRSQLESIHLTFGPRLKNFDGDQSLFQDCTPYLQDCFQSKFRGSKDTAPAQKKPPLTRTQKLLGWCLAGILLSGVGLWSWMNWQSNRHWQQFVDTLQQQPGFVVLDDYKRRGAYHLNGLRDPLSGDPQALLNQSRVNPNKVKMTWKPYLSLAPEFLGNRTQTLLNPPSTVSLSLSSQGVLAVSGRASERWIQWAKEVSSSLEGVTEWRDDGLISTEREELTQLKSRIEFRQFSFPKGKATLQTRYAETLDNLAEDLKSLTQIAQIIDEPVNITIRGYGDQRGNAAQTIQLGQTRANYLKRYLVEQGVSVEGLTATGSAISSSDRAGNDRSASHVEVRF